MCRGSKTVAYLRLIDSCITQLKAQGPSRTCNESKEEGGLEALGTRRTRCPCKERPLGTPVRKDQPFNKKDHNKSDTCVVSFQGKLVAEVLVRPATDATVYLSRRGEALRVNKLTFTIRASTGMTTTRATRALRPSRASGPSPPLAACPVTPLIFVY